MEYLSNVRIMVKSDDPVITCIAYPQTHPDNRSVQMFKDPVFKSNKYNPRIPVIIEQLLPNKVAVRAFAGTYTDKKTDKMWMSESIVTVEAIPAIEEV